MTNSPKVDPLWQDKGRELALCGALYTMIKVPHSLVLHIPRLRFQVALTILNVLAELRCKCFLRSYKLSLVRSGYIYGLMSQSLL